MLDTSIKDYREMHKHNWWCIDPDCLLSRPRRDGNLNTTTVCMYRVIDIQRYFQKHFILLNAIYVSCNLDSLMVLLSWTVWVIKTLMVPCCQKLCFYPIMFNKSSQKFVGKLYIKPRLFRYCFLNNEHNYIKHRVLIHTLQLATK